MAIIIGAVSAAVFGVIIGVLYCGSEEILAIVTLAFGEIVKMSLMLCI